MMIMMESLLIKHVQLAQNIRIEAKYIISWFLVKSVFVFKFDEFISKFFQG